MTSIVKRIREDHDRFRSLFEQFKDATSNEQRGEIGRRAVLVVEAHAQAEEELLYETLREQEGRSDEMAESYAEHHIARLATVELLEMAPADEDYAAKFEVFRELVEHHIDEEEEDLLPQAEAIDGGELGRLGVEFERQRKALLDEPDALIKHMKELVRERTPSDEILAE